MQFHTSENTVCYTQQNPLNVTIECQKLTSSFSFVSPFLIKKMRANDSQVCLLSPYGELMCNNYVSSTFYDGKYTDFDTSAENIYATSIYGSLTQLAGQQTIDLTFPSSYKVTASPLVICNESMCLASSSDFSASLTLLPMGTIQEIVYGVTRGVVIFDSGFTEWFGVDACPENPYCLSISHDYGLSTSSMNVSDIRLGNEAVCSFVDHTLSECWGANGFPINANFTDFKPSDFYLNDNGYCYIDLYNELSCVPAFVRNLPPLVPFQCNGIVFLDTCFPCEVGYELVSFTCVACPEGSIRAPGDSTCTLCPDGYFADIECLPCPPAFYKSATMNSCLECPLGYESDLLSCTKCIDGFARTAEMTSCSLCPEGSLPAQGGSLCQSCPSPFYLSYSVATTFTDGTCTRAPAGYGISGASYSVCEGATIRPLYSQTCYLCPDGLQANEDHTECVSCPEGLVRNYKSPSCWACISPLVPKKDQTGCESVQNFLHPLKITFIVFGMLLLGIAFMLREHVSTEICTLVIISGLFSLAFSNLY